MENNPPHLGSVTDIEFQGVFLYPFYTYVYFTIYGASLVVIESNYIGVVVVTKKFPVNLTNFLVTGNNSFN